MGLFDRLFGKKSSPPPQPPPAPAAEPPVTLLRPAATPPPAPADPQKDKDLIRVYDSYGRELFFTKEQWREQVLPGVLRDAWDKPDALYSHIVTALNDGFRSEIVKAAEHLYRIDTDPSRGACLWGIVLMEEGRLDEAEKVFRDFLRAHGEDGYILSNLAKVYSRRGDEPKAQEILWHALEVDPNQDNSVLWFAVTARERGGETALREALQKIARLPGSWRAQLGLARDALKAGQLDEAKAHYRGSLERAPRPLSADLLMQMSGDLGNHGHLAELIALTTPHFDIGQHGLRVGNNLIKAHLELGHFDEARQIVDALYALKRPDWKETLAMWDREIAKARLDKPTVPGSSPPDIGMLSIEGPVWLKPESPAAVLFEAKPADELLICLLGSSASSSDHPDEFKPQMTDNLGRLSRALPLFLAEQIHFRTHARVQTLIPWVHGEQAGFVVFGRAYEPKDAIEIASKGSPHRDLMALIHISAESDPWRAEVKLIRSSDAGVVATMETSFTLEHLTREFTDLADKLITALSHHAGVQATPAPPLYRPAEGNWFPHYLVRLEQLLAVRCAGMDEVRSTFLNGEREIIDGNLQLCLTFPDNATARLLLAHTVVGMKRVKPEIIAEFKEKLELLQKEKPLVEPANGVVQRMLLVD